MEVASFSFIIASLSKRNLLLFFLNLMDQILNIDLSIFRDQ
jgi:hypothetical protein